MSLIKYVYNDSSPPLKQFFSIKHKPINIKSLCQCQTQLRELYECGLQNKNEYEFTAYYILYNLYVNNLDAVTLERNTLDQRARSAACIKHAFNVVSAINLENYHFFFRLYDSCPNMSGYLLDFLCYRVRNDAYRKIIGAYHTIPGLSLSHLYTKSYRKIVISL